MKTKEKDPILKEEAPEAMKKPQSEPKKEEKKKPSYDYEAVFFRVVPILLFVFSIFLFLSLVFPELLGIAGRAVHDFFLGVLGPVAFLLPFLLFFGGIRFATDLRNGSLILKSISAVLFLLLLASLFYTFGISASEYDAVKLPPASFEAGISMRGGGVVGNLVGFALVSLLSPVGVVLVFLFTLLFFLIACFNFDPKKAAVWIGKGLKSFFLRMNERRTEAKALAAAQEKEAAEKRAAIAAEKKQAAEEKKKLAMAKEEERRRAAAFIEEPTSEASSGASTPLQVQRSSPFAPSPTSPLRGNAAMSEHAPENEAMTGRSSDNYPLDNDLFYASAEKLTPLRPVKKSEGDGINTSYGSIDYTRRASELNQQKKAETIQMRPRDLDSDSPKTIEDFARITTADTRTPPPPAPASSMQVKREPVGSFGGFDVPPAPVRPPVTPVRKAAPSDEVIEGTGGTVAYDDLPQSSSPLASPDRFTASVPPPLHMESSSSAQAAPPPMHTESREEAPPFSPPYAAPVNRAAGYTPPPSFAPEREPAAGGNESFTAAELREGQARFSAETARPFGAPPLFSQSRDAEREPYTQDGRGAPAASAYDAPKTNGYAQPVAPHAPAASFEPSAPVSERVSYFRTPAPQSQEEPKKRGFDFSSYRYPEISFLTPQDRTNEAEMSSQVAENMERLIRTLQSYGVEAEPRSTTRGPRITRYEIVPALGVRINSITNLQNEIAMNLRAESLRIEAPIPGDSAIGIEVPNQTSTPVRLRALIDTEDFRNSQDKTTIALGADIAGKYVFSSISGMPHMLVAGATGMGKSVCINTIITSLLYKARPDEVRLILVDPKMVEFNIYQGIPHLLVPVINNAKQAVGALNWAAEEMDRRFSLISKAGARDLDGYNRARQADLTMECLPRIVIVIDELNDLILSLKNSKPLDDVICRIAQKARAAGIHLIIGTQRPTVNVLTGNIKANISARIAFKVNQKVDSTTIIDAVGAEKLLDKGDMLFMKSSKTRRIQCCLVGEKEIEKVVSFLRANTEGDVYDESAMAGIAHATSMADQDASKSDSPAPMNEGGHISPDERKFWEAVDIAVQNGKAATSLLQRKLSIGYGRAAKLIDKMEELGVVSSADDKKAREVLLTSDEIAELRARLTGRSIFADADEETEDYED